MKSDSVSVEGIQVGRTSARLLHLAPRSGIRVTRGDLAVERPRERAENGWK